MATVNQVAHCQKPDCGRTWPRDPALEVKCPTCRAAIGQRCKRPSGHRVFGGAPHDARDILADQLGHYGTCPSGRCGLVNKSNNGDNLTSG